MKTMKCFRKKRHSITCPCKENVKTQTNLYSPLLNKIGSGSVKSRNSVLKSCDPCFIRYLGRCAKGILSSTIKLPKKKYKLLKGSKQLLLKLSNPSVSIKKKREHLRSQIGSGFFPILASIASTVLGNLIGNIFTK
jgi:hypothetical protein